MPFLLPLHLPYAASSRKLEPPDVASSPPLRMLHRCFSFCVSFWPIWGFLALPIVFFLFLGALNLAHFIPI